MASFGIDIGTTSCKACKYNGESCEILTLTDSFVSFWGDNKLMVSAAYLDGDDNDELRVGQEAYNLHLLHPQWYLQEFKRQFSRRGPVLFTPEGQATVDDIYVQVFSQLGRIFAAQGDPVDTLVLTHPSAYTEELVKRLAEDAHRAGFFHVETIDEPSAAAQYYVFDHHSISQGENVLVYDFGGGTFDAALIHLGGTGYTHLTGTGYTHLTGSLGLKDCGGADIDELIVADMREKLLAEPQLDGEQALKSPQILAALSEGAMHVKHKLTSQEAVTEMLMVGYSVFGYRLDRARLEEMILPLVQRTLSLCEEIVYNAGLQAKDVHRVLLVGGTSRIPLIARELQKLFPAAAISASGNVEHMVCCGAAVSGYGSEVERLLIAYQRGDMQAAYQLAIHYAMGDEPELPKNEEKGISLFREAAQAGHGQASYALGLLYWNGELVCKDHEEAFQWLKRAAEMDLAAAQYLLGEYCEEQDDLEQAGIWWRKAADQGDPDAQARLGVQAVKQEQYAEAERWLKLSASQDHPAALSMLGAFYKMDWEGYPADLARSFPYFLKAAELGEENAQYEVGQRYYLGEEPVAEDNDLAFAWLSKAAKQGQTDAKALLAECYEKGFGTPVDLSLALNNYLEAASADNMLAQQRLASWYYFGKNPVLQPDYESAFLWASKAAEQGSSEARFLLAHCYDQGHGTAQSRARAMEHYRIAAGQGEMRAEYMVASSYLNGTHGVKKDPHQAFTWGMKSAQQGYSDAQWLVGYCYSEGSGVRQDQKAAIQWYRKAADQGDTDAMRGIGIIYYNGDGNVAKNKAEAEKWFKMAAKNGDEESIAILQEYFAPKPKLADPMILFKRDHRFSGSGRHYAVRLDLTTRCQDLKDGTSFTITLQPGEHRIEVANFPFLGSTIDWSESNCILDHSYPFDPGDVLVIDCTYGAAKIYWQQIAGELQQ